MAGKPNDKMMETMIKKHGSEEAVREWYREIGKMGGSKPTDKKKGFAANIDLAKRVGAKAGKISKRGHTFMHTEGQYNVYIANDTGKVVKYKHGNNYFEGERDITR